MNLFAKLEQLSAQNKQIFLNEKTINILYFDDDIEYDPICMPIQCLERIEYNCANNQVLKTMAVQCKFT